MNIKERIRKMGPFIALVVTFIVIAALNDSFVDPNNLKNLLRQVSINALISFGMTFVILTGGIDLSVGSLLALSSALMGSLIVSGMNPMLAILAACFIGMGLGAVNGLVIAYGKVAPFIATLATMTIYRGLTLVYTMVTLSAVSVTTLCSTTSVRDFSWDCQYLQSSCCWHLPFPGSSLGKLLWAVKSTQSAATKKFPSSPASK